MFGKQNKKLEAERQKEELRLQQEQLKQQQTAAQQTQKQEDKIFLESELIDDEEEDNALPKEYEAIAYILKQEQGEDLVAQPVDDEPVQPEQQPEPIEEFKPQEQQVLEPVAKPAQEPAQLEEVAQEETLEEVPVEEEEEKSEELEEAEEETEEESDDSEAELEEADQAEEGKEEQQQEEVVYVVDGPSEDDDELVKPAKLVKLPNLVDYMLSQNMSKQMKINIATLLLSTYNKYKDIPAEKKIVIQCMAKVMKSLIQG